jgi:hypothetical protein
MVRLNWVIGKVKLNSNFEKIDFFKIAKSFDSINLNNYLVQLISPFNH